MVLDSWWELKEARKENGQVGWVPGPTANHMCSPISEKTVRVPGPSLGVCRERVWSGAGERTAAS